MNLILIAIVVSPVVGTFFAFLMMLAIYWIFRNHHPSPLNRAFRKLQVLSAAFMAFSHGTADAHIAGASSVGVLQQRGVTTAQILSGFAAISLLLFLSLLTARFPRPAAGFGLGARLLLHHHRPLDDVFQGGAVGEQVEVLKDEADVLAQAPDLGPLAVQATRETMRRGLADAVAAATEREFEEQDWLRQTEDFREGTKAMGERRLPNFKMR